MYERKQTSAVWKYIWCALPLLIVRYGGVEAATFCALMTLYDTLHHEACVDVYSVSKLYCMRRPGIWPTEVQYSCLLELSQP